MIRNIFIILAMMSATLYGQVTEFGSYNWNTFPVRPVPDSLKSINGVLITFDRHITEVYVNSEDLFEEIQVLHRKIRVETHDAVSANNKIYIPVENVIEIIAIKARFIAPDGKITELPKESIRELKNLDNEGDYRTFAIEGAETGGEIEYFYTLRRKFNAYGTVYMQGIEPRANVEVIFAFPSKLEYMIRSYNGFPDFATTTDTIGRTTMKVRSAFIPSLADEKYAYYKACLMRFEYTMTHNNYISSLRVYSWSKVCNNLYTNLYELTKNEREAVKKVIKNFHFANSKTETQIRQIEEWVKSEIVIPEKLDRTPSLDDAIALKQTTKTGATKLMIALLNEAGISFELVTTCNQENRSFDPGFDGWNFLDDYLIFFPGLQKFMAPDNPSFRLGITPFNYQGGYGLFMHPLSYNEKLKTLAYEVKKIPVVYYENNTDSLLIQLAVNTDQMTLNATIHNVFTGETAASFQSFWRFTNEEGRKNVMQNVFDMGDQNTTISEWYVKNDAPSQIGLDPFIWDVKITAHSLVEMAGKDIIVRIGETIGEQSELYQTEERKLPVEISIITNYYRKIDFTIPDGFTVTNADDLKMNVEMLNNGKISCCFNSSYEMAGNKLTVLCREYYSELNYPKERFEDFRKVVNAAADFNKKTLVLSKNQ
jgi:hypothetical protein